VLGLLQIGTVRFVEIGLLLFSSAVQNADSNTNRQTNRVGAETAGKASEPVDNRNVNPTETEMVQDKMDNTSALATETPTEETKGHDVIENKGKAVVGKTPETNIDSATDEVVDKPGIDNNDNGTDKSPILSFIFSLYDISLFD
jgi:hypothetical protein